MIDFEKYKTKMTPQEVEKLDAALIRLKTLAPEARDQILHAMELMIQCDEMRAEKAKISPIHQGDKIKLDSIHFDKDKLIKSLHCKYSKLMKLAKMGGEITHHDQVLTAVARVLNVGTYVDGALAIDLLIKVNQIGMLLDPTSHFKLDNIDMED